jgi:hypothetical protein
MYRTAPAASMAMSCGGGAAPLTVRAVIPAGQEWLLALRLADR